MKQQQTNPKTGYPISESPVRPFHLYNAKTKKTLRWRYYSDFKRAHMGALVEARWSKVGTTIEVLDVRVGKEVGQYRRRVHDVFFTDPKQVLAMIEQSGDKS